MVIQNKRQSISGGIGSNRDILKIFCQNPLQDTSSMTNKERQQMKMCSIIRGSVLSGICTRENVRFGEGLLEG